MKIKTILSQASALAMPLPDNSIHCVVTSPPYWMLRDYGVGVEAGELGQEPLADCLGWATGDPCGQCHVCNLVKVFREVRRVLHPSGTVWLNYGDMYANSGGNRVYGSSDNGVGRAQPPGWRHDIASMPRGVKKGDKLLLHARIALALQADGWWLRSAVIWHRPNPLPGPAQTWRRPIDSYELVYMLAKDYKHYFYDAEAVREESAGNATGKAAMFIPRDKPRGKQPGNTISHRNGRTEEYNDPTRHKRDVWTIPTQGWPGAHFATFPEALVEPIIKAATSEYGACVKCLAPWRRILEKDGEYQARWKNGGAAFDAGIYKPGGVVEKGTINTYRTSGWAPTCDCDADVEPAKVLDPFVGSGTVCKVARDLGRVGIGLDISHDYLIQEATKRLVVYNGLRPALGRLQEIEKYKQGEEPEEREPLPLFTPRSGA